MADRIEKHVPVRRLALRMHTDETIAAAWVDGVVETIYESFKAGESVSCQALAGFMFAQNPKAGCSSSMAQGALWLVVYVQRRTLNDLHDECSAAIRNEPFFFP